LEYVKKKQPPFPKGDEKSRRPENRPYREPKKRNVFVHEFNGSVVVDEKGKTFFRRKKKTPPLREEKTGPGPPGKRVASFTEGDPSLES